MICLRKLLKYCVRVPSLRLQTLGFSGKVEHGYVISSWTSSCIETNATQQIYQQCACTGINHELKPTKTRESKYARKLVEKFYFLRLKIKRSREVNSRFLKIQSSLFQKSSKLRPTFAEKALKINLGLNHCCNLQRNDQLLKAALFIHAKLSIRMKTARLNSDIQS